MNQIDIAQRAVGIITSASDATSLVRDLTHANLLGSSSFGCQLVSVNNRGVIASIATYGAYQPLPQNLSIWDGHSIATSIASRTILVVSAGDSYLTVLPFFKDLSPVGALLLHSRERGLDLEEGVAKIIAGVGAFYLETNGLHEAGQGNRPEVSADELTERQKQVLSYMTQGQTNAEIARAMLLSESTIRQETVRIYRILAVRGRLEASKKAKALGIL